MLADLFMRHLDTNGAVYSPYHFSGNWTEEEKKKISDALFPYVPENVDATFNNWVFTKFDWAFIGKRFIWDMGCFNAKTVEGLSQEIVKYYTRYF